MKVFLTGLNSIQQGLDHGLLILVGHLEFYANSLWCGPHNFAVNLDVFLVIGERKGECNILSNGEGLTGFDKKTACTDILVKGEGYLKID